MPTNDLPATYDREADIWRLRVPYAMPASAIRSATAYLIRINHDRWLSTSGERKEHVGRALTALRAGRVQQAIVGKGEVPLFQSTERMNPDRTIFV